MSNFLRDKAHIIFALLFFVSILPFLGRLSEKISNRISHKNELYRPELYDINSMDKAINYIDSSYSSVYANNLDTSLYVQCVSNFTKEKFYHGLSHYVASENWIAYFSGKFLWSHMSAIVDPNDILKHSEGLCSQQTIVFMELLKRKKINVRSIGLGYKEGPGHFLCEVHYNGSWRLHDVTMEPQWRKVANKHNSIEYYLSHKDSLYIVYESRLEKQVFDKITEKVAYGSVNEFPAKKMLIFHRVTLALTYFLPVFFAFMFVKATRRRRRQIIQDKEVLKNSTQEKTNANF